MNVQAEEKKQNEQKEQDKNAQAQKAEQSPQDKENKETKKAQTAEVPSKKVISIATNNPTHCKQPKGIPALFSKLAQKQEEKVAETGKTTGTKGQDKKKLEKVEPKETVNQATKTKAESTKQKEPEKGAKEEKVMRL